MTIDRLHTKNATVYRVMGDDGSWIASFDTLILAATVMRYLSGCVMNDKEKVYALAALETMDSDKSKNGSEDQ